MLVKKCSKQLGYFYTSQCWGNWRWLKVVVDATLVDLASIVSFKMVRNWCGIWEGKSQGCASAIFGHLPKADRYVLTAINRNKTQIIHSRDGLKTIFYSFIFPPGDLTFIITRSRESVHESTAILLEKSRMSIRGDAFEKFKYHSNVMSNWQAFFFCSMSPANINRMRPTPKPAGVCHGTWNVARAERRGVRKALVSSILHQLVWFCSYYAFRGHIFMTFTQVRSRVHLHLCTCTVHTLFPYIVNGWADCVDIWCVATG